MDPAAKKQRRRSIRNLRKSTCLVPPSLDYGSAWIGHNQDTNISNLVNSLEDLQCQDDLDVEHRQIVDIPQNIDRLNYEQEEACDGFQFVQPLAGESCIGHCLLGSKGEAARSPVSNNGFCFRNTSQLESISSPVNVTLPLSMSCEMLEVEDKSCANRVIPQSNDQVTYSKQYYERERSSHSIEPLVKSRDTLIGTELLDIVGERNCNNNHHTVLEDHVNNWELSPKVGNNVINMELNSEGEFYSELVNTVPYEPRKLGQADSANSFPCQQENGTEYTINSQKTNECNERLVMQYVDSSVSGNQLVVQYVDSGVSGNQGNDPCGDIVVEDEISRRSSGYQCQYNSVYADSLNDSNSMSPEFKDYDSFSGKLAESTHSFDLMNKAMTFLDVSAGSAFNMSFSPLDLRPDTPTSSSSVPCNNQSGDQGCPKQLRQSISDIICSLEDPIITSDPDTSLMVHNGGLSLTGPGTSLMVHNSGMSSLTDPDTSLMVHKSGMSSLTDPDTSLIVHNGGMSSLTDPDTSLMVHNGGMSSLTTAAVLSPLPHDSRLAETVKELNTTYTLPSSALCAGNLHNEIEGMADDCEETDHQRIESSNTIVSIDVLDAEPMMIMDFDFKTSKRNKRRSSNFVQPNSVTVKSHTTPSGIETLFSAHDTGTKEYSMDTSPRMEKTIHESTEFVTSVQVTEIINSTDSNVIEQNVQMIEPGLDHEVFIQSTSQSPFSDCGNMLASQEIKTKKKTRRKSNKLARLLEESERFLPESTSQELKAVLQCGTGDKENKSSNSDTEVEVSSSTDQGPPLSRSRNLRTRPSRKSWDFRKDSQNGGCSDVCLGGVDSQNNSLSSEVEDLQLVYSKQTYEAKSPQPLETIKESANEKSAFNKQRIKRYLKFGCASVPKEKKRIQKALNVYRGRQCFFPVTDQEFERKMLDVQLLLDFDLEFSI